LVIKLHRKVKAMQWLSIQKSKNCEERIRVVLRRIYFLEFGFFILSLVVILVTSSYFVESAFLRVVFLLLSLGGVSGFHYLFHRLWDLYAEWHDRLDMSKLSIQEFQDGIPVYKSTIKIIVSSENAEQREVLSHVLSEKVLGISGRECDLIQCKSYQDTLSFVTDHIVDLVILDYQFQETTCLELAEKIKSLDKNIPVIVCADHSPVKSPFINAWFTHLQRDSDIRQILPYFLVSETKTVTRKA
jgi:CheY-like chemotaxis protein